MSIAISGTSLDERFLRYVKIDTTADPTSPTSPSTQIQFDLLHLLVDELKEIGAQEVMLTDYGAVLAAIPATVQADVPTVALLAHVDTAPQFSGTNVKPIVHRGYDGEDLVLPDDPSKVLSPKALPYLGQKVGDDVVTASGTTLLGADDKAGVAIVMTAARHLLPNPDTPARPDPHLLHARRGDRPRRDMPTCRSDLRRRLRLHARRRRAWARSSTRPSPPTAPWSTSRASRSIPARPRTSWSTRCTSPPRSSTRCRRSR